MFVNNYQNINPSKRKTIKISNTIIILPKTNIYNCILCFHCYISK